MNICHRYAQQKCATRRRSCIRIAFFSVQVVVLFLVQITSPAAGWILSPSPSGSNHRWLHQLGTSVPRHRASTATPTEIGNGILSEQRESPRSFFLDWLQDKSKRDDPNNSILQQLIIHWRGESLEDYSIGFRHLEYIGAVRAILKEDHDNDCLDLLFNKEESPPITFTNALLCNNTDGEMSSREVELFNNALQYVNIANDFSSMMSMDVMIRAAERCSLVNSIYHVGATGYNYSDIVTDASSRGTFDDMMVQTNGPNQNSSWRFRLRYFGDREGCSSKGRFGDRSTWSSTREKKALPLLRPLLEKFGGDVDLKKPDWTVVLLDGLGVKRNEMVLTRRLADGVDIAPINPNTRICVTNTPLAPIASLCMCNMAEIGAGHATLDPYAGSASTLLAAALIEPTARCVGIEIAHDGLVCREDIWDDFTSRGLKPPLALIEGDSKDPVVRDKALCAIGDNGEAFDAIVADPPYGIREQLLSDPLQDMLKMISDDRDRGRRLLKLWGKLVVFVPCDRDDDVSKVLPKEDELKRAGMRLDAVQEQRLNDGLSRWLVAYTCVS